MSQRNPIPQSKWKNHLLYCYNLKRILQLFQRIVNGCLLKQEIFKIGTKPYFRVVWFWRCLAFDQFLEFQWEVSDT